jgi:hypothetical protein
MDIKTILLSAVIVTMVYGWGLYLYQTHQKTFPGFRFWVAACFIISMGYLLLMIRAFIPLYLSIIVGNLCFGFGAMLRLDGVYRFAKGFPLKKFFYITLIPLILLIGFFHFIIPNIVIRSSVIGLYNSFIALNIAYTLFIAAPESNKKFFHAAAIVTGIAGLTTLFGPLLFKAPSSDDIFLMGNSYATYYLIILAYEISWGLCLVMINNQRVESELKEAERDLRKTNIQLEKTIKEKITLSGLLPICSNCKKIRDDKGYWNHLEAYIETHSEADFSHSICPECAEELYPDIDLSEDISDSATIK